MICKNPGRVPNQSWWDNRTELFKTHQTATVLAKPTRRNGFTLLHPTSHTPNAVTQPPPPKKDGGGTPNSWPMLCCYFLALPPVCVEMS